MCSGVNAVLCRTRPASLMTLGGGVCALMPVNLGRDGEQDAVFEPRLSWHTELQQEARCHGTAIALRSGSNVMIFKVPSSPSR